ncbi:MAG: protein kinase [Pseudomonadota bacterium]
MPLDGKSGEAHASTLAFAPGALAAPLSRYTPGAILSGKYRLLAVIGEGGMGAVWRASNELLDLPVAIKLIRADLDRSSLRARLQIEARAAAKLGHPAIVRVYDVGETAFGDPFIVMELLQGETLGKVITRGRLSAARAVQVLLPVIEALALAHARGIVHRDLKPDNVMLAIEDQRVQPKILDFGIAKLTDPRDTDHKLTEVGVVVGSPDYMSPEQARGLDDVDASSDIWAMCVVLYEAVTGVTPFSAPNYNALLRAILEDTPKSLVEHAAGDAALWQIVERGLAKDRNQRHPSMTALGRALAGWLLSHGISEDACGASLDSKWFGRGSDPAMLAEGTPSSRPPSYDFQPNLTQDSRIRGAFTASIHARAQGRVGAIAGAVLALCVLLGSGAYALNRAQATAAPGAAHEQPRPHAALPGTPRVSASPAAVPLPQDIPPPPEAAPVVVPTSQPIARPVQGVPKTKAEAHGVHPTSAARSAPTGLKPAGAATPPPLPSSAPVPATKPAERPLDLMAPY